MSKPAPKQPLTDIEREGIKCLHGVGMPVASWDKRFRRDVLFQSEGTGQISDKAVAQLWRMVIRYRRQWSHAERAQILRYAEEHSAPDYRKQQAAARAQWRIDELKRKYQEAMNPLNP